MENENVWMVVELVVGKCVFYWYICWSLEGGCMGDHTAKEGDIGGESGLTWHASKI